MDSEREESMVRRAIQGDAAATTLLLKDSRRWLCAMIAERVPGDLRGFLDADDVVQEAHVDVFRHVNSFEWRGPGSFHRWALKISRRRLRAAVRAQRAERRGGGHALVTAAARNYEDSVVGLLDLLAAPGRTPSRSVARLEGVQAVEEALKALPDHYLRAVKMVYIDGQPIAAAAAAMGCTDRAIHGYCRRGLKQLREGLGTSSRFFSSMG